MIRKYYQNRDQQDPKTHSFGEQQIPKSLDFHYSYFCNYDGHIFAIRDIFMNNGAFLSFSNKQLHVWTSQQELEKVQSIYNYDPSKDKEKAPLEKFNAPARQMFSCRFIDVTKSSKISCICYSQKLGLYFVASADFKVHIFNDYLSYAGWWALKTRSVGFIEFLDDNLKLITAGVDGCFMYQMSFLERFNPKQALALDPDCHFVNAEIGPQQKFESMPLWVKGFKVLKKNKRIFTWSDQKATFHDYDGKLIFEYHNMFKKEDQFTDVIINNRFNYFVTSAQSGAIFVWKYYPNKQLVHKAQVHTDIITTICNHPVREKYMVSASNDCTIKVITLENFQTIYSMNLEQGAHCVKLLNDKYFAYIFNDVYYIKIGELMLLGDTFQQQKSQVKQIKKVFRTESERLANDPYMIMSLYADNSIQITKADPQEPKILSIIYPPPQGEHILFFDYCMNLKKILILFDNGTLNIYNFIKNPERVINFKGKDSCGMFDDKERELDDVEKTQHGVLEMIQPQNAIKDLNNLALTQSITSMTLCKTIPPQIDEEILSHMKRSKNELGDELEAQREKWHKNGGKELVDRFIAFGLDKGSVIFVPIDEPDRVYTRMTVHHEAIRHIKEMPSQETFITICDEKIMTIWKFDFEGNQKFTILNKCNLLRNVLDLVIIDNSIQLILIGFEQSDLQLFAKCHDENENKFVWCKIDNYKDHEKGLSCMDCYDKEQFLITGCDDGVVKIWNSLKQLVRAIRFPDKINAVTFLNSKGDILVAHGNNISYILANDYGFKKYCSSTIVKEFNKMVANSQREINVKLMKSIQFREDLLEQQLDQLNPNLDFKAKENSPNRVADDQESIELMESILEQPYDTQQSSILSQQKSSLSIGNERSSQMHSATKSNNEILIEQRQEQADLIHDVHVGGPIATNTQTGRSLGIQIGYGATKMQSDLVTQVDVRDVQEDRHGHDDDHHEDEHSHGGEEDSHGCHEHHDLGFSTEETTSEPSEQPLPQQFRRWQQNTQTTESSQEAMQKHTDIFTRPPPRKIYHRTKSRRLSVEKFEKEQEELLNEANMQNFILSDEAQKITQFIGKSILIQARDKLRQNPGQNLISKKRQLQKIKEEQQKVIERYFTPQAEMVEGQTKEEIDAEIRKTKKNLDKTPAIPRPMMEHNYKRAIQRKIRIPTGKDRCQRRANTIKNIQNNIKHYNQATKPKMISNLTIQSESLNHKNHMRNPMNTSTANPYQNQDFRKKGSNHGARSTSAGVRAPIGSLGRRSIGLNNEQMTSMYQSSAGFVDGMQLETTQQTVFKSTRKNTARQRQGAQKDGTDQTQEDGDVYMGMEAIKDDTKRGPVTNSQVSDSGTDGLTAQKMNPNLVADDVELNHHEAIVVDDEQSKDLKTGTRNNQEQITLLKKDNTIHESNKNTVDTGPVGEESATLEGELSKRDENENIAQTSFDHRAIDFVNHFSTEPNSTTFGVRRPENNFQYLKNYVPPIVKKPSHNALRPISQIGKKTSKAAALTKIPMDPKLLKSLQGKPDGALISINLKESSPPNMRKTESASIEIASFENQQESQPYSQYGHIMSYGSNAGINGSQSIHKKTKGASFDIRPQSSLVKQSEPYNYYNQPEIKQIIRPQSSAANQSSRHGAQRRAISNENTYRDPVKSFYMKKNDLSQSSSNQQFDSFMEKRTQDQQDSTKETHKQHVSVQSSKHSVTLLEQQNKAYTHRNAFPNKQVRHPMKRSIVSIGAMTKGNRGSVLINPKLSKDSSIHVVTSSNYGDQLQKSIELNIKKRYK